MSSAKLLSFEDGKLSLGGTEVPGSLIRMSNILCDVKFDEAESDQLSGTKKTPMGYEDASLDFEFLLDTDDDGDCYDKLKTLNDIFKDVGAQAEPQIFTVTNRHAQARGIEQVVFASLGSRETNEDDSIVATLHFEEHRPPVVESEERVVLSDASPDGSAPAINPSTKDDFVLDVDVG
jgi:hypothetical protein